MIGYWKEQELTGKPPFRALVASLLKDDTTCGEAYIEKDDPTRWHLRRYESLGGRLPENAKVGLKPGESLPVRRKDVAGRVVKESRIVGGGSKEQWLEYYWSLEDRDEWLTAVAAEFDSSEEKPANSKDE